METADSKGILSVCLEKWRGGGQQQIEEHSHRNVPEDSETITKKQVNYWGTETPSPGLKWLTWNVVQIFVGFVLSIIIPPLQLLCEVTAVHVSVLLVA